MTTVATVESLWRYPVKSMAGEELSEAFVGFSGVYGDHCYAFRDAAARKGFHYLNANAQQRMLLYRPRFRHPVRASAPPNLAEAMAIAPVASRRLISSAEVLRTPFAKRQSEKAKRRTSPAPVRHFLPTF